MSDLSTLSDDQLKALYQQSAQPAPLAGMSDEQLKAAYKAAQPNAPITAEGLYKAADRGVSKFVAATGGTIGDLSDLGAEGIHQINRGVNWVGRKAGLDMPEPQRPDYSKSVLNAIPRSRDIEKAIQSEFYNGAEPYKPQNTAERYTEKAGEFFPGILTGRGIANAGMLERGAELGRRLISNVVAPSAGAETARKATEGTWAEPYAEVAGGVAGGSAPALARRLVTPNPISPERQRLLGVLENEGVTSLTAGQRTGNKSLQYAESAFGELPFAGSRPSQIQQEGQRQFTEAAMRRTGGGAAATPENLQANHTRLGQEFRDLSANNTLTFDHQFGQDAMQAVRNYQRVPPSQQRAMVEGYVQDIVDHMQTGQMPGAYYQEMRSRLSRQANGLRQSDPTLSETLRDLRNALDNAMERSIAPQDARRWQEARQQYGAQKTVEKAASRAGESTTEGNIVPANLRNAVAAENRGMYARGQGQFSELARAGSGVMAPLPNSGTGQRVNTMDLLNAASVGVLKPTLGASVGRALMSRPVQAYLGNQLLRGEPDPHRIARLLAIQAPRASQSAAPQ